MSSRARAIPLKTDLTDTSEVLDTPDIQAFRNFDPTAQIQTISPTLSAQFNRARRENQNSFAYSGISNPVMRQRMQADRNQALDYDQATATAQLFDDAQRRRMGQLGELANLTATRRNRRTGTQDALPGGQNGGGFWGALGAIGSTALGFLSDERLKENQQPTPPVLPRLNGVQTYNYNWRETGEPDTGVMAQELGQSFPEAVQPGDEETPWMVNPKAEAELALQGLKELNQKVDELARRIDGNQPAVPALPAARRKPQPQPMEAA